ncbi:NRAMP family divalent metal transporter [Chromobacterium sp. IIBBL 290-4]|uniref:NRAMP family divalent metal transporter n=1 Tax=Chromobacterium sp. IIBBL 290-4 TaxID=2953890 RepID=UPI0020B6FFC7|nr:divalent metal cation transporter [Chromobacterium sp. IIBBL 290-4]UTH74610.1 divalent metal cation transporter [Chromobacterium sp. IIBBL 290-4]
MSGADMSLQPSTLRRLRHLLAAIGPGLVVMLADTETGSVIAAAQSGAHWGYRMLPLLLVLIPLLYMAQELTIRLALGTGQSYGELVVRRWGRRAGQFSAALLLLSCLGALATQLSGLAGVGQMFGVPTAHTVLLLCALIFIMVCTGSYRSVERTAIALGVFELAFLAEAWLAHPSGSQIVAQLKQLPLSNHDFLLLAAANIGTCIMPWTICYQQSAMLDKGLTLADLKPARLDTLLGATLCQVITAGILIAAAVAFGNGAGGASLDTIPEIAGGFTRLLGPTGGKLLFALALSGGALVATIVVCLCGAWTLGEMSGQRESLEKHPLQAPWFYGSFALMLAGAGALVSSGVNLVKLSIATSVANALLLPIMLAGLYWLACKELPPELRPSRRYQMLLAPSLLLVGGFSLYAGIVGSLN